MSANVFLAPSPVAPPFLLITGITNANPMVVTVSTSNSYVVGQLATFTIPFPYGIFQLDGLTGLITAVAADNLSFSVAIDSNQFDAFVTPSLYQAQPATLTYSGSRNIYNTTTASYHSVDGSIGN